MTHKKKITKTSRKKSQQVFFVTHIRIISLATFLFLIAVFGGLASSGFLHNFLLQQTNTTVLGTTSQKPSFLPILYETTSSNKQATGILTQLGTTFVFRGTFRWGTGTPTFDSHAAASIKALKAANPKLVFEGGIGTQLYNLEDTSNRHEAIGWGEKQIEEGVDGMFFDNPYVVYGISSTYVNALFNGDYGSNGYGVIRTLRNFADANYHRKFFAVINTNCDDFIGSNSLWHRYPYAIQQTDYVSCGIFPDATSIQYGYPYFLKTENQYAQYFSTLKANVLQVMGKTVPVMVYIDWNGCPAGESYHGPQPSHGGDGQYFDTGYMGYYERLSTSDKSKLLTTLYNSAQQAGVSFVLPAHVGGACSYDAVGDRLWDTLLSLVGGGITPTPTPTPTTIPTPTLKITPLPVDYHPTVTPTPKITPLPAYHPTPTPTQIPKIFHTYATPTPTPQKTPVPLVRP